jgi:putative zinc finger/helix-turn-helix YgiT family protein
MPSPIKELPFPWTCGKCGEQAVERDSLPYSTVVQYDGRSYAVDVPDLRVPCCKNCGDMVFDDSANDQVTDALRRLVGLLPPDRIRSNRESLGLTQRDFANLLGMGESTVSRWETSSQIQQRSLDRLMRLFFALPEVRDALVGQDRLAELGTQVGERPEPDPAETGRPDAAAPFRGDPEHAKPLAELASRLDALTEAKRHSALVEFQRLTELMMN